MLDDRCIRILVVDSLSLCVTFGDQSCLVALGNFSIAGLDFEDPPVLDSCSAGWKWRNDPGLIFNEGVVFFVNGCFPQVRLL